MRTHPSVWGPLQVAQNKGELRIRTEGDVRESKNLKMPESHGGPEGNGSLPLLPVRRCFLPLLRVCGAECGVLSILFYTCHCTEPLVGLDRYLSASMMCPTEGPLMGSLWAG